MEAKVSWKSRMSFTGTADSGFEAPLGTVSAVGGDEDGFKPMELFLIGLAGCTGMDVMSILSKKRQEVSFFDIKVQAERTETHPRVFTRIFVEYVLSGPNLDLAAVERAVELSTTRYCPGQAMLSKTAQIESKITIVEPENGEFHIN
jgi:putative redox protein